MITRPVPTIARLVAQLDDATLPIDGQQIPLHEAIALEPVVAHLDIIRERLEDALMNARAV